MRSILTRARGVTLIELLVVIENGIFGVPLPPTVRWYYNDYPANHHRGVYNMAIADGHVETIKYLNLDNRKTSGYAPDDIKRLQDALPQPR